MFHKGKQEEAEGVAETVLDEGHHERSKDDSPSFATTVRNNSW
jgi:hypothetical protein